ncbi:MAG: hypothetical protein FWF34_01620 [Alphaproteobacteria bacterium]|nr:hypothetical protein [Alphaproteobacteria bacterium]MCL2889936.1 hypothetical protein [Alphaproteobacteria bacterium]
MKHRNLVNFAKAWTVFAIPCAMVHCAIALTLIRNTGFVGEIISTPLFVTAAIISAGAAAMTVGTLDTEHRDMVVKWFDDCIGNPFAKLTKKIKVK